MLQELREQIIPPLSRSALADLIGRSPNYILKAESLTFPTVPPSLLNFYTTHLDYPRPLLISQYRDAQRHRRRNWLNYWQPVEIETTSGYTARQPQPELRQAQIRLSEVGDMYDWPSYTECWISQFGQGFPTEYAISQGLCIPAAAVYNAEHKGLVSQSIRTALQDLVDYCESGEVLANTHLTEDQVTDVLAICQHWSNAA